MIDQTKESFERLNPGKTYSDFFPPYPAHPQYRNGTELASSRVKVSMEFVIPVTAKRPTEANIEEWLRFHFGHNGLLHGPQDNPLSESGAPDDPKRFEWEFI